MAPVAKARPPVTKGTRPPTGCRQHCSGDPFPLAGCLGAAAQRRQFEFQSSALVAPPLISSQALAGSCTSSKFSAGRKDSADHRDPAGGLGFKAGAGCVAFDTKCNRRHVNISLGHSRSSGFLGSSAGLRSVPENTSWAGGGWDTCERRFWAPPPCPDVW